jgi:hypothetical protein
MSTLGDSPGKKAGFPHSQPTCEKCGATMSLAAVEAAYFYKGLNQSTYACECGNSITTFTPAEE